MQINEQGKEPRRLLWVFSSYYYYNYLLYGQSLPAFVSLLASLVYLLIRPGLSGGPAPAIAGNQEADTLGVTFSTA